MFVVLYLVRFEPAVEDPVRAVPDQAAGEEKGGGKRTGEPRHPRDVRRDRGGEGWGDEHQQTGDDEGYG